MTETSAEYAWMHETFKRKRPPAPRAGGRILFFDNGLIFP